MTKKKARPDPLTRALLEMTDDMRAGGVMDAAAYAKIKARINEAWNDPLPSRPAGEVFDRIEDAHAEAARPKNHRA